MEEELKRKTELIKKQENLIQGWRNELKNQLDKHITELDRVQWKIRLICFVGDKNFNFN